MEYEQAISAYICRYCKGSFDHLENLQKHVQQIHTPRSNSKEKHCPLCGLWCVKYETYRDHLKHIHRQTEEGKAFILKCLHDFFVWKNELEKRNYCKYIAQGPPKVIQQSKDKIQVYCCDSSTPTSKQKRSACAAKDTCPSMISAIENVKNRSIKVEYWNTHIGHAIPVQAEELDAAIGSLQTTEIVVDEQGFVEQDSESAIFFLTESNDGSFSESYVKDTQRKPPPPALFQNNSDSSSSHTPKSMPRNFSFKKDPSKKSASFSGSLASVACMKANVKKDSSAPTTFVRCKPHSKPKPYSSIKSSETEISVTSSATETSVISSVTETSVTSTATETSVTSTARETSVTSTATETSVSQSTPISSVASTEIETSNSQSPLMPEKLDLKITKRAKTKPKSAAKSKNKKGKDSALPSTSHITSQLPKYASVSPSSQLNIGHAPLSESILSNLKLMVNDGKLNGQFILLNSLESQNGQHSLILCPVDGNLSSGGQLRTAAVEAKGQDVKERGKCPLPESQQSSKSPIISSIQNVLTIAENGPCPAGVERIILPPGPSVLKKQRKQVKSTKLKTPPTAKTPKARKRATRKNLLAVGQKLSLVGATSSNANTPNQVGTKIIPSTVSPSIKGIITVNTPMKTNTSLKPSPVLSNSFSPVANYIQINNTLFPYNSPVGSNLSSNYVFTSPMSSAQNLRPPQSLVSFSALAQPATTLVMNTTKSSVVGTAPINAKNKLPTGNLPMVVISQLGSNTVTTPISLHSSVSASKSTGKPAISSPMTKSVQALSSSILPHIGKIRSQMSTPFIQNNAQFIPSPRMVAITQPAKRHAVPTSFGLRGMRPILPTLANTAKVKKVRLPSSSSVVNSPPSTETKVNPTSKSTNVNSVVSNTEPISSTPAITIPPTPIAYPQKPGSYVFESSGDLYLLEPIEDSKSLTTIEKDKDTKNSGKAQSDAECPKNDNGTVKNLSETDSIIKPINSEKVSTASSNIEAKVESKPKRPKICPTFSDGEKIAALPQKRRLKEDDSEILKKIKYYNMEMKYLSSQAECKRLKLELAKYQTDCNFQMHTRSKPSFEDEPMALDQDFSKEKTDVVRNTITEISDGSLKKSNEVVIDLLIDSLLKQVEKIQNDKKTNIEDDLHDKLKVQSIKNELKAKEKETSLEANISKKIVEIEDSMDYEVVSSEMNDDIIVDSMEVEISAHVDENKVISCQKSNNEDVNNQDIEVNTISPPIVKEMEDKPMVNNELLNTPVDNCEIMDVSMGNSLNENESKAEEICVTSTNNSETYNSASDSEIVNICIDSLKNQLDISSSNANDGHEINTILDDQIQTIEEESDKCHASIEEQVLEINNIESDQYVNDTEGVQYFDSTKSEEVLVNPCEDEVVEETLKELEIKYGEKCSDIYTMIRTSVLRSLYADMKELCQENKKLFEELQSLKSHGESYEVVVEETQIEQL